MNRVLVVDDEAGMRCALEASFLQCGLEVDTAANAGEALEKFCRELHPLVVTNIRMPGCDGYALMRAVLALAPSTSVILLTEFAESLDAVRAMKAGACDYMAKPVNFHQLKQSAQSIMSWRKKQSADAAIVVSRKW